MEQVQIKFKNNEQNVAPKVQFLQIYTYTEVQKLRKKLQYIRAGQREDGYR